MFQLNQPYKRTVLLFMTASIIIFSFISYQIIVMGITGFDGFMAEIMPLPPSSVLTLLMEGISILGSVYLLAAASLLLVLYMWRQQEIHKILFFLTAMFGGVVLNLLLKIGFGRSRPENLEAYDVFGVTLHFVNYSFPSGHTMRTFIFYGCLLLFLLTDKRIQSRIKTIISCMLASIILLVGISRVYLEAHYPSDIIAGYTVSLAWMCICIFAVGRMSQSNSSHLSRQTFGKD
ncbi:phosphatase PAP2 family protein [Sutcliffiella horikoshii]|uniref:phosphatase PAP2 family protein n=1 Tax=Sutcliffiella horikoshii TaxID=79883 RepID=UPI00384C83C2